jgi:hypothetical protein
MSAWLVSFDQKRTELTLQLRVLTDSESIGNHDSKIVGACGVD